MYVYVYVYVRTHAHTHIYMCVYVCVCVYIYIYIYIYKALGRNMATLRKTEFFHLEIAGKVRPYHGCCLDRSLVCINKIRSLMKSHWIRRCKSFPKSMQLAILSAPLRVIWPSSAGNVSSKHFLQLCFIDEIYYSKV